MRWISSLLFLSAAASLAASHASAGCCRIVKVDAELPPATVRVCEAGASGECEVLLFNGTLALGESQNVCTQDATLLYEELDPATGSYMAPVEARCEGGDVEL